jgi:hypothetical protein
LISYQQQPIEMPCVSFLRLCFLRLKNLGLNGNHCEDMAHELARDDALLRPIGELTLAGYPSIGQQGHEALLGLLNRRFHIGTLVVDDLKWKTIFDLVIFMNLEYYLRGRFLENGVFPSKLMWIDFLVESTDNDVYGGARNLNAIWHTLREDP